MNWHKIELIGKHVEAEGIRGKIIDETKNMIVIKDGKSNKTKKITKKNHTFIIKIENKELMINGDDIAIRPEERAKL